MPREPNRDLCAVILAGGSSRRMGTNKAFLCIDGEPLVERLAREARLLTDEVRISTNDPGPYRYLRLPLVADRFPGRGPLAGLDAGFAASGRRYLLLLACDLPNARARWLAPLVELARGWDAVIPTTADGRSHPLCAVYDRTCFGAAERNLRAGVHKMTAMFEGPELRVRVVTGPEAGFEDDDLRNLNSPEDLRGLPPISGG